MAAPVRSPAPTGTPAPDATFPTAAARRSLFASRSVLISRIVLSPPARASDHASPRDAADVPIQVPLPDAPGRYRLKLDLVAEGIDWFEACGSPTTSRPLLVW